MKRYVLYRAHGKKEIFYELCYSIYSILKIYEGVLPFEIVVYTDQPEFLKDKLPSFIVYKKISEQEILEWSGNPPFIHRIKVKIFQDFMANNDGAFLYLDTDIVLLKKAI